MLRSIKQLYGEKLRASDGEIGHVRDFYFDDQKWFVRYAVMETGSWLLNRLVLIGPHAFGNLAQNRSFLLVNLTRQQIENGPRLSRTSQCPNNMRRSITAIVDGRPTRWEKESGA